PLVRPARVDEEQRAAARDDVRVRDRRAVGREDRLGVLRRRRRRERERDQGDRDPEHREGDIRGEASLHPVTPSRVDSPPALPITSVYRRRSTEELHVSSSSAAEVSRWMRVLALPFFGPCVAVAATLATGSAWLMAPAVVLGPGLGIIALTYLALSS